MEDTRDDHETHHSSEPNSEHSKTHKSNATAWISQARSSFLKKKKDDDSSSTSSSTSSNLQDRTKYPPLQPFKTKFKFPITKQEVKEERPKETSSIVIKKPSKNILFKKSGPLSTQIAQNEPFASSKQYVSNPPTQEVKNEPFASSKEYVTNPPPIPTEEVKNEPFASSKEYVTNPPTIPNKEVKNEPFASSKEYVTNPPPPEVKNEPFASSKEYVTNPPLNPTKEVKTKPVAFNKQCVTNRPTSTGVKIAPFSYNKDYVPKHPLPTTTNVQNTTSSSVPNSLPPAVSIRATPFTSSNDYVPQSSTTLTEQAVRPAEHFPPNMPYSGYPAPNMYPYAMMPGYPMPNYYPYMCPPHYPFPTLGFPMPVMQPQVHYPPPGYAGEVQVNSNVTPTSSSSGQSITLRMPSKNIDYKALLKYERERRIWEQTGRANRDPNPYQLPENASFEVNPTVIDHNNENTQEICKPEEQKTEGVTSEENTEPIRRKSRDVENQFYVAPGYRKPEDSSKSQEHETETETLGPENKSGSEKKVRPETDSQKFEEKKYEEEKITSVPIRKDSFKKRSPENREGNQENVTPEPRRRSQTRKCEDKEIMTSGDSKTRKGRFFKRRSQDRSSKNQETTSEHRGKNRNRSRDRKLQDRENTEATTRNYEEGAKDEGKLAQQKGQRDTEAGGLHNQERNSTEVERKEGKKQDNYNSKSWNTEQIRENNRPSGTEHRDNYARNRKQTRGNNRPNGTDQRDNFGRTTEQTRGNSRPNGTDQRDNCARNREQTCENNRTAVGTEQHDNYGWNREQTRENNKPSGTKQRDNYGRNREQTRENNRTAVGTEQHDNYGWNREQTRENNKPSGTKQRDNYGRNREQTRETNRPVQEMDHNNSDLNKTDTKQEPGKEKLNQRMNKKFDTDIEEKQVKKNRNNKNNRNKKHDNKEIEKENPGTCNEKSIEPLRVNLTFKRKEKPPFRNTATTTTKVEEVKTEILPYTLSIGQHYSGTDGPNYSKNNPLSHKPYQISQVPRKQGYGNFKDTKPVQRRSEYSKDVRPHVTEATYTPQEMWSDSECDTIVHRENVSSSNGVKERTEGFCKDVPSTYTTEEMWSDSECDTIVPRENVSSSNGVKERTNGFCENVPSTYSTENTCSDIKDNNTEDISKNIKTTEETCSDYDSAEDYVDDDLSVETTTIEKYCTTSQEFLPPEQEYVPIPNFTYERKYNTPPPPGFTKKSNLQIEHELNMEKESNLEYPANVIPLDPAIIMYQSSSTPSIPPGFSNHQVSVPRIFEETLPSNTQLPMDTSVYVEPGDIDDVSTDDNESVVGSIVGVKPEDEKQQVEEEVKLEVFDYWDCTLKYEDKKLEQQKAREDDKCDFIDEIPDDLFHAPPSHSLVHCVAEDMLMGQGIAVEFRRRFHRLGELLNQRCKTGEVAVLGDPAENPQHYIYYLVTKNFSYSKPLLDSLEQSVVKLKELCLQHGVTNLAMPLIGCGRDQLAWRDVLTCLRKTFLDTGIKIAVYKLEKVWEDEPGMNYLTHRDHMNSNLKDLEQDTARVFLASEGPHLDATMTDLNTKFRFLQEYKQAKLNKGGVYRYECKYPREIVYGLVVKGRDKSDNIDFQALENSCKLLTKMLGKDKYSHLGVEGFFDPEDATIMEKIITIMKWTLGRSCKNAVTLHTCYPTGILMLRGSYDLV